MQTERNVLFILDIGVECLCACVCMCVYMFMTSEHLIIVAILM